MKKILVIRMMQNLMMIKRTPLNKEKEMIWKVIIMMMTMKRCRKLNKNKKNLLNNMI
jgi:hypothetical protein